MNYFVDFTKLAISEEINQYCVCCHLPVANRQSYLEKDVLHVRSKVIGIITWPRTIIPLVSEIINAPS